jgi:hypothetical protein
MGLVLIACGILSLFAAVFAAIIATADRPMDASRGIAWLCVAVSFLTFVVACGLGTILENFRELAHQLKKQSRPEDAVALGREGQGPRVDPR